MHHRGEETDLGTSRSLTRLPFVPRNTVGRGRTESRVIAFHSLLSVTCYLFFVNLVPCVLCIIFVLLFSVIPVLGYLLFVVVMCTC